MPSKKTTKSFDAVKDSGAREDFSTGSKRGESIVNPLVWRCQQYEAEIERLQKACERYGQASIQSHSGHWDPTGRWGAGCPECNRAAQLRSEAEAFLKEEDTHEIA